jgi:hypothetical protein
LQEFACARHDILNESVHREVASVLIDFIDQQTRRV